MIRMWFKEYKVGSYRNQYGSLMVSYRDQYDLYDSRNKKVVRIETSMIHVWLQKRGCGSYIEPVRYM